MINARYNDKALVVDILTQSFKDNRSVNYIIMQDNEREQRLRKLMIYSFKVCYRFGKVFLSNDKKGCALVILPEKKKTTLWSIYLDIVLIFSSIGLLNIKKAMKRESKISKLQCKGQIYYLWFIGVHPGEQHKGIGSNLLNDLIKDASLDGRIICLETSTVKNIPWYEKFGFEIYNELDLGYKLYFLKKAI